MTAEILAESMYTSTDVAAELPVNVYTTLRCTVYKLPTVNEYGLNLKVVGSLE